jgi:hypothetical protein
MRTHHRRAHDLITIGIDFAIAVFDDPDAADFGAAGGWQPVGRECCTAHTSFFLTNDADELGALAFGRAVF